MATTEELLKLAEELRDKFTSKSQIDNGGRLRIVIENLDEIVRLLRSDEEQDQPKPFEKLALPADDLTKIKDIDSGIEGRLNALGVTQISQIASWTAKDVSAIDNALGQTSLPQSQNWIEQAAVLCAGKDTLYSSGADVFRSFAAVTAEVDSAPRDLPDDLTLIRAIDSELAGQLNARGVTRFSQIANWTAGDVEKVSQSLDIGSFIQTQNWIEQAAILAAGKKTYFAQQPKIVLVPAPPPLTIEEPRAGMAAETENGEVQASIPVAAAAASWALSGNQQEVASEHPEAELDEGGGESLDSLGAHDTPSYFPEPARYVGDLQDTGDNDNKPELEEQADVISGSREDEAGVDDQSDEVSNVFSGDRGGAEASAENTSAQEDFETEIVQTSEEADHAAPPAATIEAADIADAQEIDEDEVPSGPRRADLPAPDFSKMARPVDTLDDSLPASYDIEQASEDMSDQADQEPALQFPGQSDEVAVSDEHARVRGKPEQMFPGWYATESERLASEEDGFEDDVKVVVKTESGEFAYRSAHSEQAHREAEVDEELGGQPKSVFPPFADFNVASRQATSVKLDETGEDSQAIRKSLVNVQAIPQAGLSGETDNERDGVVRRFFRAITDPNR